MAWPIHERLAWQDRKIMGEQWISAIDSIGANIAEGFGRYHFRDKNQFNYHARASLLESIHWTELLRERGKITGEEFTALQEKFQRLHHQLNTYIQTTRIQLPQNSRAQSSTA